MKYFYFRLLAVLMLLVSFGTINSMYAADANSILGKWNAIVAKDVTNIGEIEGRIFIGGNYNVSNSHQFGFNLSGNPVSDVVFAVQGNAVSNGQANIKVFYGSAAIGSAVSNNNWFQFMQSGGTLSAPSNWAANNSPVNDIKNAAAYWKTLTANSTVTAPSYQPGPLKFNCAAGQATAIFNVTDTQTFENSLVQQIELVTASATKTIIINVKSADGNVNWAYGNMVGNLTNNTWRSRVIWNFYTDANNGDMGEITLNSGFGGALIAPTAKITTNHNIDGSVVAEYLNSNAEIHLTCWNGDVPEEPTICYSTIGSYVYHDVNINGAKDSGEEGIANVTVELLKGTSVVATTVTGSDGKYLFLNIVNGTYSVKIAASNFASGGVFYNTNSIKWYAKGNTSTAITINCADNLCVNFGFYKTCVSLTKTADKKTAKPGEYITYTFVLENCGDVVLHGGVDVKDPLVKLDTNFVQQPRTTSTFTRKYLVKATDCGNLVNTAYAEGHPVLNYGTNYAKTLDNVTGQSSVTVNINCTASIGDKVWIDSNKNGIQDNSETGLKNVTVELYTCANVKKGSKLTDADGKYLFDSLQAGSYYVKFILPDARYEFTTKDAGNDALDSDVIPSSGITICTDLSIGENDLTWDAGVYEKPVELGSIGDKVWLDVNKNGIQDQGEAGVQNITVQLYSCADVLLSSAVTNTNGLYLFDSLNAGSYYVKFSLPGGYEFSPANAVTDDAKDSDADITTGRTTCFTLDQGEDDLTWDAGISEIVIPENGSIGDKVWLDGDKDGQQDDSEAGVSNVTVKLYNCDNTLLSTTLTNNAGNYLFTELPAGSYYVMFVLPDGYTFTSKDGIADDEEDSDADQTTGRTVCFTLAEGQDDLSRDAGLQVVTAPELWLTKDDNRTVMPKTNEQNTYTIKYGNKGGSAIYKAYIEDILPEGTSYVSCSGGSSCAETWAGSKVVKWQIGTIEPGQSGQVTITVKVDTFKAQYVNSACINGQNTYKDPFQACDDDVNIADSCSGGHEGGVESRGEMAELLLLRKLKIQYGMTTPIVAKSKGNVSLAKASLNTLLPESGPYNSVPVETTPFDILGISNAVASYAADYMAATEEGQKRVATIFSTITEAPYIYDHSKQVCDRLANSEIQELSLSVISGHKFYTAKMLNADGLTDYAVTFSIYETASGYQLENKWTYGEYDAPSDASTVYNFQVWSNTLDGTLMMVKDVIARFKAMGQVSYMNNSQAVPNIYISKAKYSHDGNIYLTVTNNYSPVNADIKVKYRESQGANKLQSEKTFSVPSGTSEIKFPVGIVSDASVYMSQANVNFKDEVYVSGGAYTYITGEKSTVSSFNTSSYTKQDMSNYPSGSLVLAGGAAVSGELKDYVSVVRSLTAGATAYDLSKYGALRFDAHGKGKVSVIIDLTTLQGYNYFTYELDISDNMQTYSIPFSSFTQKYGTKVDFDASKIKNIGFVYSTKYNSSLTSFNFEVTNIAFTPSGTTGVEETETTVPSEFSLEQNYPNPFNPSTMINFDVPKKEMLTLKVYNVIGQEVAVLVNGELEAGKHSVKFDAANLSSGVYFYKLNGASVNITRKMILTK